jgi:hypothetical protein
MVTRTWVDDKSAREFFGGSLMARHNFREIVLMVLAVLGGLGILLLIGTHLSPARSILPGNGGVVFAVSGVSVRLFALAILALVAIAVMLAVFLWRR